MDIQIRKQLEQLEYIKDKLEYIEYDEALGCYIEKQDGLPTGVAAWVNGAFYGFEQATKAQAVPDLSELQEMIAGHQYSYGEHGHMIVDMDDVIKEISSFDSYKAQAVPEGFAIKDVINERQRQINHEFYSTEHDDEYKSNELLRAALCYAKNVLSRGWVHRSSPNSGIYQSEEVPDFWPWDQDFWKPKSPRRDLVRAAALLIAEIERIDRSTGASQ